MEHRRPSPERSPVPTCTNLMAARVLLCLSGLDGGCVNTSAGLSGDQLRSRLCGNEPGMVHALGTALRDLEREGKVVRVGDGADGVAIFRLAPELPRRKPRRSTKRRDQRP